MPQPRVSIPGIEALDLRGTRRVITPLHDYLHECIIDGRIPPGTTLSQVALARQLGVSVTPVREVLRMLQEEGLVEFEPNQRMRVTGIDPVDVDVTYAARIMLECLAVAMTVNELSAEQRRQAESTLTAMSRAARVPDQTRWFSAHGEFHRLLATGASDPLHSQLRNLADRSARYMHIRQELDPQDWPQAGNVEHRAIFEAVSAGDESAAVSLTAHHLERTARRVVAGCAPDFVLKAVPKALATVRAASSDATARLMSVGGS
ncbi:GntR family transcriptional regulator [Streptomyces sp. NBC_00063]|uniref:GntR family transcriptional regulator n=1 Tax=Streptomyces sp. NBC_00063 TaxID=2975638 RepID=UPI003D70CC0B